MLKLGKIQYIWYNNYALNIGGCLLKFKIFKSELKVTPRKFTTGWSDFFGQEFRACKI